MTFDFFVYLRQHIAWSQSTFGPGLRTETIVDHIRKELVEIEFAPKDLEEWIDVIILGLDGAWRTGAMPAEIGEMMVAKLGKNERRQWPDWRTADMTKAVEHIR